MARSKSSKQKSVKAVPEKILYEGKLSIFQFFKRMIALSVSMSIVIFWFSLYLWTHTSWGAILFTYLFVPAMSFAVLCSHLMTSIMLRHQRSDITISNRRLVINYGHSFYPVFEHPLSDIEDLQVSQHFLGSLFNFGSLVVKGKNQEMKVMPFIRDPFEMKTKIEDFCKL